jgi:hypothetical protein
VTKTTKAGVILLLVIAFLRVRVWDLHPSYLDRHRADGTDRIPAWLGLARQCATHEAATSSSDRVALTAAERRVRTDLQAVLPLVPGDQASLAEDERLRRSQPYRV